MTKFARHALKCISVCKPLSWQALLWQTSGATQFCKTGINLHGKVDANTP